MAPEPNRVIRLIPNGSAKILGLFSADFILRIARIYIPAENSHPTIQSGLRTINRLLIFTVCQ